MDGDVRFAPTSCSARSQHSVLRLRPGPASFRRADMLVARAVACRGGPVTAAVLRTRGRELCDAHSASILLPLQSLAIRRGENANTVAAPRVHREAADAASTTSRTQTGPPVATEVEERRIPS